jgi:rare lipoprotein A
LGFSATLRRTRRPLACVPLLCTLVAVPTAALARTPHGGTGGVGITGGGSAQTTTTSTSGALAPDVVKLDGVVNASGDGITLTVAASGIQGQPLTISGNAPTSDAGALIDIESTKSDQATWTQVATATIGSNGSFSAQWTPATSAQVALRAVLATAAATPGTGSTSGGSGSTNGGTGLSGWSTGSASAASGELTTSALTIPIFKDALATLYGPGFWGHHTACGERLTHATLGVASRTLKCGTRVAVFYKGREITVPVIDRGPFANGARWDLTMATAKALGIKETVTIGTLSSGLAPALSAHS